MEKGVFHEFTVEGGGQFPFDMLRYDSCWPAHEYDSHAIAHDRQRRRVRLRTFTRHGCKPAPTVGRWQSFMWRIVPECDLEEERMESAARKL